MRFAPFQRDKRSNNLSTFPDGISAPRAPSSAGHATAATVPFAFHIDHRRSRLNIVGSNPVGLSDLLEILDRQVAEDAWSYATLHDARLVTWTPSEEAMRAFVAFVETTSETLGPRGPVAFVGASSTLAVMAGMFSRIGAGSARRAEVFRSVDAAARWLDGHARR